MQQIAYDENGKRVHIDDAIRGFIYSCPTCDAVMFPRKGLKNKYHFAHKYKSDELKCDTWKYDISDWHLSWQNMFLKEYQEVTFTVGNERHRADVFCNSTVVEFQHSKMNELAFNARNQFYTSLGHKVIWLFDVRNAEVDKQLFGYRLKKEIAAINSFDNDNVQVEVYLQMAGDEIVNKDDNSIVIRKILSMDNHIFKLSDELYLDDFMGIANEEYSFDELMLKRKREEERKNAKPLRRLMGNTDSPYINARNIDTDNEVRVENNEENFNSINIVGQIKMRGHTGFTSYTRSIWQQKDPVWILSS